MKMSSLSFLKILKTLNKKVSYIDSIAKKSSESLIKIESAISESKSTKGLSLWFQRLTGWASIVLAFISVILAFWSGSLTIENRKLNTRIDSMDILLQKQDTQILNQQNQILVLTDLAKNSKEQINQIQNLILQSNYLVSASQSQIAIMNNSLKSNNNLLTLQLSEQEKKFQASYFDLKKTFNSLKIPKQLEQIFNTSCFPPNKPVYEMLITFIPLLDAGRSNQYLFYDTVAYKKWNSFFNLCSDLRRNINLIENYDGPEDIEAIEMTKNQKDRYSHLIGNQKCLFINQYRDLKKYLDSVKLKTQLK